MLLGSEIGLSYALAAGRDLELHVAQLVHQVLLSWICLLHSLGSDGLLALLLLHQKVVISFLAVRHLFKSILMKLTQSHILTVLFARLCRHDGLILFSDNGILAPHVVQSDVCWRLYLPPCVSRLGSLCWLSAQALESGLNVEVLHLHLF